MGSLWLAASVWLMYEINLHDDLFTFKSHKLLKEYSILAFAIVLGLCFLYKGKTRHVIFDLRYNTMTIKKRNIFCDKRSITEYSLKDIHDVQGVHRGYKRGGTDTEKYFIIVQMK